jgi:hypothetical protein
MIGPLCLLHASRSRKAFVVGAEVVSSPAVSSDDIAVVVDIAAKEDDGRRLLTPGVEVDTGEVAVARDHSSGMPSTPPHSSTP